jgi:hypothetical protein
VNALRVFLRAAIPATRSRRAAPAAAVGALALALAAFPALARADEPTPSVTTTPSGASEELVFQNVTT